MFIGALQFYGAGLWLIKNYKKNTLKQFSVGYHKAIKKTLNVPFYYGNHLVCKIVNLVTLEHQLDIEKVRLIRGIFIKPPDILKMNYEYFLMNSVYLKEIEELFFFKYDFSDILKNDMDAIIARVYYKHNSYNDDYVFY